MGHRSGESREQAALFPLMLDDLVGQSAMVRVVDAWVSRLNMHELGFKKAQAQVRGAPPYAPDDLLKLYILGYLRAVRSSRELELECHRNVEFMWMLGRLAPDHKTIADFRRLNSDALLKASAAFIDFALSQKLIKSRTVAIDGTKLKAVASRKSVLNRKNLLEQARRNAEEIAAYLKVLDEQDRQEKRDAECRPQDVLRVLDELRAKGARIDEQLQQPVDSNAQKLVQTEPEAQVMSSLYGAPGYNLQTAVEVESHLIVHHEVCADANDQRQLLPTALAAKQVLDRLTRPEGTAAHAESPLIAVADGGYVNGEHFAKLEEEKIITFVAPKPGVNPRGLLDKSAFRFDAENDRYICPQGKVLKRERRSEATTQARKALGGDEECGLRRQGEGLRPMQSKAGVHESGQAQRHQAPERRRDTS
jgi:transposase